MKCPAKTAAAKYFLRDFDIWFPEEMQWFAYHTSITNSTHQQESPLSPHLEVEISKLIGYLLNHSHSTSHS